MTAITIVRPITSITIGPEVEGEKRTVSVNRTVAPSITVKRDGSSGPAGPVGPQGPAGAPGSGAVEDPGDLTLWFNNALI